VPKKNCWKQSSVVCSCQPEPKMGLLTNRLRLEPLEARHADALFQGLQNARIYDFITDRPPESVEALRERYSRLAIRRSPTGTEIWLNWAVWSLDEERYVGYVQATVARDYRVVLAYVFFPDAWNKGYAREAVRRMIDYLVARYPGSEFRAFVDVRNKRSTSLLGDLGFVRVAVQKGAELIHSVSTDQAEYLWSSDQSS
jgi:ribosomal-protein-alanine N-acetyltransferase